MFTRTLMSAVLTASDAQGSEFQAPGKIVLLLCGLIASGKSTFAKALQEYYPEFRRCNQDDLGDRRRVEQLARETLNQGLSVCIDRTNFNTMQRSYWIEIAREFPGTAIWVIVFDTPYEICAARLQTRTSHPTIKSPEQGLSVLSRLAVDFQHPSPREEYQRILYVKASDHPSPVYSRSDISAILQRVQRSALVAVDPSLGRASFRGHSNRGRRGGWGDASHPYYRISRGRAGGNPSIGSSYNFRGSQSTSYRGNNVGLHGTGRGTLHYPSGASENQGSLRETTPSGTATGQDAFVID